MPVRFNADNPTPDALERYYRETAGLPWHADDAEMLSDPLHRARMDWLAEAMEGTEGTRVLDMGCGTGIGLRRATAGAGMRVGCDIAERGFDRSDGEIHFVAAAGSALPFRDGTFDAVMCSEVLEHLTDPDAALGEIRRVLRSGGRLAVTAPNLFCWDAVEGKTRVLERLGKLLGRDLSINTHLVKGPPGEWRQRIEQAGFRVIRDGPIYPVPYIPYFIKWLKGWEAGVLGSERGRRGIQDWTRRAGRLPVLRECGQLHGFVCETE